MSGITDSILALQTKVPDVTPTGKFLRDDGTWQTAGGGSFSGDMDDIPDGSTYVKTENNLTDAEKTKLSNLSGTNSGDNAVNSNYSGLAASKQDALVSGTNIKTINGSSILGSGDLSVSGSGLAQYQVRQMIRR